MGNEVIHQALEGRLLLIHLLCKHTAQQSRRLYAPCVSFRIAGSPGKNTIKEQIDEKPCDEKGYQNDRRIYDSIYKLNERF